MNMNTSEKINVNKGRWTKKEHSMFLRGYGIHGRNWMEVSKFIPTRTTEQIRSHAQKFFNKINKSKCKLGMYYHFILLDVIDYI